MYLQLLVPVQKAIVLKESSGHLLVNAIFSVSEGAAWLDPGIAQMVLKYTRQGATGEKKSGKTVS